MQIASLVIGIIAFIGMIVGLIPCFGSLNWLNIPFSVTGLIISGIALVSAKKEENKGGSIAGIIFCAVAILFGIIRLIGGFGVV